MIPKDSPSCYFSAMRNPVVLFIHLNYGTEAARVSNGQDGDEDRKTMVGPWGLDIQYFHK